jgi:hypothetical protein
MLLLRGWVDEWIWNLGGGGERREREGEVQRVGRRWNDKGPRYFWREVVVKHNDNGLDHPCLKRYVTTIIMTCSILLAIIAKDESLRQRQ